MARNRPLFHERHRRALAKRMTAHWLNYARVCLGTAGRRWILIIGGDRAPAVRRRIAELARLLGDGGAWVSVIGDKDEAAPVPSFWSAEPATTSATPEGIERTTLSVFRPYADGIVAVGNSGRAWLARALDPAQGKLRLPPIVIDTPAMAELSATVKALEGYRMQIADAALILA
jgi:hypothetical protein